MQPWKTRVYKLYKHEMERTYSSRVEAERSMQGQMHLCEGYWKGQISTDGAPSALPRPLLLKISAAWARRFRSFWGNQAHSTLSFYRMCRLLIPWSSRRNVRLNMLSSIGFYHLNCGTVLLLPSTPLVNWYWVAQQSTWISTVIIREVRWDCLIKVGSYLAMVRRNHTCVSNKSNVH